MSSTKKQAKLGFIGTYTRKEGHVDGKAPGLFSISIDPENGVISLRNIVSGLINPSYLCLSQKAENLSSITVKLPAENVSVPGIYYFIFQRLAWEGIVLYEVISTTNEFTILVNEEQSFSEQASSFSTGRAMRNTLWSIVGHWMDH